VVLRDEFATQAAAHQWDFLDQRIRDRFSTANQQTFPVGAWMAHLS
jgi:hypothetical protein